MYTLIDDEKAYLRIAYDNGYRWIATNEDGFTYFYDEKPEKIKGYSKYWSGNIASESLLDFGTSCDDEEPIEIAKLIGVVGCGTKPLTPVFVRDYNTDEWTKAYFVEYIPNNETPYMVTFGGWWKDKYGNTALYRYCRLATKEEIREQIEENLNKEVVE